MSVDVVDFVEQIRDRLLICEDRKSMEKKMKNFPCHNLFHGFVAFNGLYPCLSCLLKSYYTLMFLLTALLSAHRVLNDGI